MRKKEVQKNELNIKLWIRKYDELEEMLKRIHEIMNPYPEVKWNIEVEFIR